MFNDYFRGKRVLVTGHTGFKGSWLCEWLLKLGAAEVGGYSVDVPTKPSHFEVLGLPNRMRHVLGDIRDARKFESFCLEFKPEVVFHLAAQPLVRDSYDDPVGTFHTNVLGTAIVLDTLRRVPSVQVAVNISSDKCYENREWEFGYRETDPMGGKDPYSASKGCAELVFASMYRSFFSDPAKTGLRLASARAGNVIGGGDWAKDRIVVDCMKSWAEGKSALIRSPNATRPWQHVLEPLSGYLWLASQLGTRGSDAPLHGEGFNFGPKEDAGRTVGDLISAMQRIWTSGKIEIDPAGTQGKKEAGLLKLTCDRALLRLSWRAALVYEETVSMTVRWYQTYYRGGGADAAAAKLTASQIADYERLARERGIAWAS